MPDVPIRLSTIAVACAAALLAVADRRGMGRIEDIRLTYVVVVVVVVHIWDDRRLVLPTSYFTTRLRAEFGEQARSAPDGRYRVPQPAGAPDGDARVFGGDPDSWRRRAEFTGPDPG